MTTVPPLPEPGLQSSADRQQISRRFIQHAREELEKGNRLQAGEKAWGAVAQYLKIIGEQRGWSHTSHRQLESIAHHVRAEYPEYNSGEFTAGLYAAYRGHDNFYENHRDEEEIEEAIEGAEQALPALESLIHEAPRPFTITSNSQLRRLKQVTGDNQLQIGDTSDAGFSLRH